MNMSSCSAEPEWMSHFQPFQDCFLQTIKVSFGHCNDTMWPLIILAAVLLLVGMTKTVTKGDDGGKCDGDMRLHGILGVFIVSQPECLF